MTNALLEVEQVANRQDWQIEAQIASPQVNPVIESSQQRTLQLFQSSPTPSPRRDLASESHSVPDSSPDLSPGLSTSWEDQVPGEIRVEMSDIATASESEAPAVFIAGRGPVAQTPVHVETKQSALSVGLAPAPISDDWHREPIHLCHTPNSSAAVRI